MTPRSQCLQGTPYADEAVQTFCMVEGGLDQHVQVRHLGTEPLPTGHTAQFPPGWDLNARVLAHGSLIDNGYTGWGIAHIDGSELGLWVTASTSSKIH